MLKLENQFGSKSSVICNDSNRQEAWTITSATGIRSNVLDLLDVFAKPAITGYMFMDINMSWAQNQKTQMESSGHKVTATAIILKAIAIAQTNCSASRTQRIPVFQTVTYEDVVAGFTVEREVDGKPVVFFGEIEAPDKKSVFEIAEELSCYSHDPISQVRKLKQQTIFARFPWIIRRLVYTLAVWFPPVRLLCMRSTFGLSSLGALGIKSVCGPSVCTSVFGVGAIESRAVVKRGVVVAEPVMTLTLSYDQRSMNCFQAARFLQEIKGLLEGKLADYEVSQSVCIA